VIVIGQTMQNIPNVEVLKVLDLADDIEDGGVPGGGSRGSSGCFA
jgi:hypothetical protein